MGCAEVGEAMEWAKQSTKSRTHPVTAFLSMHIGQTGRPGSPVGTDICIYAYGPVTYVAKPTPRLAGDLLYFGNGVTMTPDMLRKPDMTIGVEIFPDDQFTYQFKFKGEPVIPTPTKLAGTCLDGVLLTATRMSDVVSIGVRRDPVVGPTKKATKTVKAAKKAKTAKTAKTAKKAVKATKS